MKVAGFEVPESLVESTEAWMQLAKSFTAAELVTEIKIRADKAAISIGHKEGEVLMRLADRLIQKHRKAGNIVNRAGQGERSRWGWK